MIFIIGILFVRADRLLVRWLTHVFANPIAAGAQDQLLAATDFERSNSVHMLLGALQRLDHKSNIPILKKKTHN